MKYRKAYFGGAAIAICLALAAASRIMFSDGELRRNESTDMTIYRVELGGNSYCVPKAYYRWSNSFNEGEGIGLDLSLDIYSLEAWSLYEEKDGLSEGSEREVGVKVLDQTLASRQKRWSQLLKASHRTPLSDGYYRYEGAGNPLVNLDYYLIPQDKADFSWVLGCVSGARCRLESQLDKDIFYELSFDERHVSHLIDLEDRVKFFLEKQICNE